jgi:hypothetical protein
MPLSMSRARKGMKLELLAKLEVSMFRQLATQLTSLVRSRM